MTSSALLVPARSVDAQDLLSPRGYLAADLADCFGKSPRTSFSEHLKPQFVSEASAEGASKLCSLG